MKKIIAGTFLFTALFSAAAFGAEDAITLNIDGEELVCDVAPQIIDGRTMVPVRAIFEAVGAEVSYDGETKTVTAVKDDTTVIMVIDSRAEEINGEQFEMDTAPVIIDGRTLAPARYVAEAFGCDVIWNGDTKTVDITTPPKAETEIKTEAETESETETETGSGSEEDEFYHGFNLSFFKENAHSLAPVDYTGMSDENAEIHETIRQLFEQFYLYMEISANIDTLNDFIEEESFDLFTNTIHSFWEANLFYNASNTLSEDADESELTEYINSLTEDCSLDSDDNFLVLVNKIEDGTSMLLLEMAEDEYDTSCLYIAVIFDENGSLKYYTLEKSSEGGLNICQVYGKLSGTTVNVDSTVMKALTSSEQDEDVETIFLKAIIDDYFS